MTAVQELPVIAKWSGDVIDTLPVAGADEIDAALTSARASLERDWPPAERARVLRRALELLDAATDELVATMSAETAFTLRDVRQELARACVTLRLCAEEATRIAGEAVALDASDGFGERIGFTVRVPIGVVLAITPFNTPLNGVLHKVGPALAAGNAVVLKPAELTPLTAEVVAGVLREAGLPGERLHVLHGPGDAVGLPLLRDERVDFTTFTGSTAVGAVVKRETGVRPVALELGSIAAALVCADADLGQAADAIVRGGYRKAGQVCTSVQRIFVERAVADELGERLAEHVASLRAGDPADPATDVGPVITEAAAARIEAQVSASVRAGATALIGGRRSGTLVEPTLLAGVEDDMAIATAEAFGPVVAMTAVESVDEAIERANRSRFGLQGGLFTSSIATALRCARRLEVGGLIVNDSSSTRADGMPFGGQKASGFGKEGPRYAMRQMMVERLVLLGP